MGLTATHADDKQWLLVVAHTSLIDQQPPVTHTPAAAVMERQKDNQQGPVTSMRNGSTVGRATLGVNPSKGARSRG